MIKDDPIELAEMAACDAHEQAALVRSGAIERTAPLAAAIAQIEALDPKFNAVSHRAFAHAAQAAETCDPGAPMAGIPYLLKASMEYPGFPAESGSRFKKGVMAKRRWPFAARMDDAGLIPCGMSCMPEFGLLGTGEALLYGPTRNPWAPDRSGGGSSSGAAVAVATRMVPFATGSDGGGSIRIPASHCGIVGFKPSRNWNLRARAPALVDDLLTSDGLLGRSMRDTAWAARYLRRQPIGETTGRKRLRIAIDMKGLDGQLPDGDVVEVIERSAKLCADLGHALEYRSLPLDLPALDRAFDILWSYGGGEVVDQCRAARGGDANRDLEPWTLGLAERRAEHSPDALARALTAVGMIDAVLGDFWKDFDCVLSPVTSSTAPVLGLLAPDRAFEDLWRDHFRHVNYTQLQNMAGYPAISLPLFLCANGLPAGAMFWTRHGGDDLLLALGTELEEAHGFTRWTGESVGRTSAT